VKENAWGKDIIGSVDECISKAETHELLVVV